MIRVGELNQHEFGSQTKIHKLLSAFEGGQKTEKVWEPLS